MQFLKGNAYNRILTTGNNKLIRTNQSVISSPDVTSGLVARWKFDEGSGTTANDSAGSNTATLFNGPTYTTPKIGLNALQFDGSNDYVKTNGNVSLPGAFTITLWFKPTALQGAFFRLLETDFATEFYIGGTSDGSSFQWMVGNVFITGGTYSVGTWLHLAATFDGVTGGELFVNATSVNSGNVFNAPSSTNLPIYMGTYPGSPGAGNQLNGILDDVRIYSRVLSGSEITTVYNFTE